MLNNIEKRFKTCLKPVCLRDLLILLISYIILVIAIVLNDSIHGVPPLRVIADPRMHIFPIIVALFVTAESKMLAIYINKLRNLNTKYYESQEYLKVLIDTIPTPVFYKNLKGEYIHCNNQFADKVVGMPKEEIIGRTILDFKDVLGDKVAKSYDSADKKVFRTLKNYIYDEKIKLSDGQKRHFTFYKSLIFNKNKVNGLVGIMWDITDKIKINELLEKEVKTDPLTKLFNRRYFDEIVKKEISLFKRYSIPFSLMIVDIDNFKNYNDTYGHIEGDKTLIQVARILEGNVRDLDMVFRFGGEEFLVLFSNTDLDASKRAAKRIVEMVEKDTRRSVKDRKLKQKVTISAGLKEYKGEKNIKEFIDLVDKKLYLAKKKGKNQVIY